jgi:hypothetical protein
MKNIIVLVSMMAMTSSAIMAQKTTFGIRAGIQETSFTLKMKQVGEEFPLDAPRTGFIFGGIADIKFSSHFSVQPNLLLAYKPGRFLLAGDGHVNTITIDVPVNVLYHTNGFFIGAGPNLSYGISSKYKPTDEGGQEEFDLYAEEEPFKRFEIGVNGQAGYQLPCGLAIIFNYTRGLNNLSDLPDDPFKVHYKNYGISIGYMFGCTKAAKK